MSETEILFEIPTHDRDKFVSLISDAGGEIIDEIEVNRLDGVDSINLLVELSKILVSPSGVALIIGILNSRRVIIKRQGIEYRGPFDEKIIKTIFRKK